MRQNPSPPKKTYTLVPPMTELPDLFTTCPKCGGEVELVSREETICLFCGHKLYEREGTSH